MARQTLNGVFVHLVWATWDRAPLLIGETCEVAYRAIDAKCEALDAGIVALGGVADHVHLLIQLLAALSVAALVKDVKGSSGHLLAKQAMMANGAFFKWQGSYGAFSVSPHELDLCANYIRGQAEHHAAQQLIARWELPANPERARGGGGGGGEASE